MTVNLVAVLFSFLVLAVPSCGSPYDEEQIIPSAEPADFLDLPVEGELQLNALSDAPSEHSLGFPPVPWERFHLVPRDQKLMKDAWGRLSDPLNLPLPDIDIWARFPSCPEGYSLTEKECDVLRDRRPLRNDFLSFVYHHVNSERNKFPLPQPPLRVEDLFIHSVTRNSPILVTGDVDLKDMERYPRTCLVHAPLGSKEFELSWNSKGMHLADPWKKERGHWPYCAIRREKSCPAQEGASICRRCPPYQTKVMATDVIHRAKWYDEWFYAAQERTLECKDIYRETTTSCPTDFKILTLEQCLEAAAQFGMSAWLKTTDHFSHDDGKERQRHMDYPSYSTFHYYTLAPDGLLALWENGITDNHSGGRCFVVELSEEAKVPNKHAVYWATTDLLHHKDVLKDDLAKRNAKEEKSFEVCRKPTFSSVPGIGVEKWSDLWDRLLADILEENRFGIGNAVDIDIWARFPTCPDGYSLTEMECEALSTARTLVNDLSLRVYHHVYSDENRGKRWPEKMRTEENLSVEDVRSDGVDTIEYHNGAHHEGLADDGGKDWDFELHRYPKTCMIQTPSAISKENWRIGWNGAGSTMEKKESAKWKDSQWPWCHGSCQAEQGASICRRCPPYKRKKVLSTNDTLKNGVSQKTATKQILKCGEDKFAKAPAEGLGCAGGVEISNLQECREAAAQFGIGAWTKTTDYFRKNRSRIISLFNVWYNKYDEKKMRERHEKAPTFSTFYFYTLAEDGLLVLKQDGITDNHSGGRCFVVELSEESKVPNKHAVYWATIDLLHRKDVLKDDLAERNAKEETSFEVCKDT